MKRENFRSVRKPVGILFVLLAILFLAVPVHAAKKPLTDLAITDAVEDEMLFDPGISPAPDIINVETRDGIVTLNGTVDNLLAKKRAGHIAETVKGVRAVVNNLEVAPAVERSD